MNREIKFRGIPVDRNCYIYGFYAVIDNIHCILQMDMETYIPWYDNRYSEWVEVRPETVSQFTGLYDKNGKEIYEGNSLKGYKYPFMCEGDFDYFSEVCWFEDACAFGLYVFKNPESNVRGISSGNTEYMEGFHSCKWEIIGDIFTTPELIGETDE